MLSFSIVYGMQHRCKHITAMYCAGEPDSVVRMDNHDANDVVTERATSDDVIQEEGLVVGSSTATHDRFMQLRQTLLRGDSLDGGDIDVDAGTSHEYMQKRDGVQNRFSSLRDALHAVDGDTGTGGGNVNVGAAGDDDDEYFCADTVETVGFTLDWYAGTMTKSVCKSIMCCIVHAAYLPPFPPVIMLQRICVGCLVAV